MNRVRLISVPLFAQSASWLYLLCLIAQMTLAQDVKVKLNPTGRNIELTSLLRISDSVIGETQLTITPDDQILLPKESVIVLLEPVLSEPVLQTLKSHRQEKTLSKEDFSAAGLVLTFDASTLECVISVDNQQMKMQEINLSGTPVKHDFLPPEPWNGYLNVSLSANQSDQHDAQSDDNQTVYNHRFDAGLNYHRMTFENESVYNSDNLSHKFARQGSRLNVDFPEHGTRLVVGDMYNQGTFLQDGVDVLGVGLTRDFTLIPTRNVRPRAARQFSLQRTSTVDVVIDGVVVRRLTLNAGSYNLNDIPLAQGNNEIELVITDSSGQTERIPFSVATDHDLLQTGEFEYSILAGVPSRLKSQQIDYFSHEHLLHGYLEAGVAPWLTLGINGQSRDDLYQLGTTALVAAAGGTLGAAFSFSHHPVFGEGHAARLGYDMQFSDSNASRPRLGMYYDYRSHYFAGANNRQTTTQPLNQISHYVAMFGAVNVTQSLRVSMNTTFSHGVSDSSRYWSVSPGLSGSLFDTPATWSTRVNYQRYDSGDDEVTATLTLSWPLSRATRIVSRYQSDKDHTSVDWSYRRGIGNTGGISAFASIENQRDEDVNVDAGVNYTGNRFEAIAEHATRYQSLDESDYVRNSRLKVAGSLAFSGDEFAFGRPVGDSFAVITKHESLRENRVAIDPAKSSGDARVESDSGMNVLLPDLHVYQPQLIGYDVEDLPPGYDLGDGAFSLNPGYGQGYQLMIGSDAVLTVMGALLDKQTEQPLALVSGQAVYLGDDHRHEKALTFFTNRKGIFAISGMRPGRYRIELNTSPDKRILEIDLAPYQQVFIKMGKLYVD